MKFLFSTDKGRKKTAHAIRDTRYFTRCVVLEAFSLRFTLFVWEKEKFGLSFNNFVIKK